MKQRSDVPYLEHILDAINKIEDSVSNLFRQEFKKSADISDAVVRRIEVIGEAVKNISDDLKKKYPGVEWTKIAGTRDVMIHAYFNVDLDVVWDIVKKDLPSLKKHILKILKEI